MSTQPLFWFHVEPVLTAVRTFGEKAKNSRIVASTPADPSSSASVGMLSTRDMVTEVTGFGRPLDWTAPDVIADIEGSEGLDIVKLRTQLRESLRRLERRLQQEFREPNIRNIMHPLVIHADERLMTATLGRAGAWAPLQLEFFEFDDGGVQFYTKLEELLSLADTPALVFEVFYFCLRDGFRGLHAENPARIEDYKARLAARLPLDYEPEVDGEADGLQVELVEFPYRYYLTAAGVVVSVGLLLWLTGWLHGAV